MTYFLAAVYDVVVGIVLKDFYIICVKVKTPIVGDSLQLSALSFASSSG